MIRAGQFGNFQDKLDFELVGGNLTLGETVLLTFCLENIIMETLVGDQVIITSKMEAELFFYLLDRTKKPYYWRSNPNKDWSDEVDEYPIYALIFIAAKPQTVNPISD